MANDLPRMIPGLSRRSLVRLTAGGMLAPVVGASPRWVRARQGTVQEIAAQSLPIRWPDSRAGEGFLIRHGYACENPPRFTGWWHTGENWYASNDADTAGAEVLAVAPGTVVFAGYDYPGPVVIVQHKPFLFSMYGHLDYALSVQETDVVEAGQVLGTVLRRTDAGGSPSHLHFEIRTFLIRDEINGDHPGYGVNCGYQCAPGPGYWPMEAPQHPSELGWLNPLGEMTRWRQGGLPFVVVANASADGRTLPVRAVADATSEALGSVTLAAGDAFTVSEVAGASPDGLGTSAEAYAVWYRVTGERLEGWVPAIATSSESVGTDGRPSSVEVLFVPDR